MQVRQGKPVSRSATVRKQTGSGHVARLEFDVLIRIVCLVLDDLQQLTLAIPDVEFAAVPVSAYQSQRRDSDAPDVVADIKPVFDPQGIFIAALDHRTAVA